MSNSELVCVGLATVDTIVTLPRWPDPDGRVVVDGFLRSGGGPAATAAVAAARLGRSVTFVGAVGSDASGRLVGEGLAAENVDVAHLARAQGRTPESVILVDGKAGTRSIIHSPGAALDELSPHALAACTAAQWVHVDHAGWSITASLPRGSLSVDAGNDIPDLDLAGLGLYAPNLPALLRRYPGLEAPTAVKRALAEGAQRVVVTMGADGALAADATGGWRVPVLDIDAVSTLGAGDVFHGAFLAMLIEGRPLPEALRAANVAAVLSCRGLDARAGIPTRSELDQALLGYASAEAVVL